MAFAPFPLVPKANVKILAKFKLLSPSVYQYYQYFSCICISLFCIVLSVLQFSFISLYCIKYRASSVSTCYSIFSISSVSPPRRLPRICKKANIIDPDDDAFSMIFMTITYDDQNYRDCLTDLGPSRTVFAAANSITQRCA